MSTQRHGMSFGSAMVLLALIGLALWTLDNSANAIPVHSDGIHAADDCYAQESGGFGLGIFRLNKGAIRDTDCERARAARFAVETGMDAHARAIVCSLDGAVATFGSEAVCMEYDGSTPDVIVRSADRESYCKGRKRKWYRRAQFWNNSHFYRKCLRDEV